MDYQPIFFTRDRWPFIFAACDNLLSAGGKAPGALETCVPIFIDHPTGTLCHSVYTGS
ncbi:Gluconate 2-dehydrogenase subunit 3 GADH subunit 3 [Erwinia piriflorinigrans CFBP 5888]|uniref:Gluconate 2-dehydrogenase subunit 3 GADH subunit 3 n=1 Tax=Erwinia piriflorinigrans CFBP 5888 TaxID=1161919 RepID=V5Z6D8_9GAMM|nr:Gluconate 2-dehydrogenase subunit 3 GADH subunit 3 [Erwinia piriflorinigrans CFBP 5888]